MVVMDRLLHLCAPEANAIWSFELAGFGLIEALLERVAVQWQPQLFDVAVEVHSRQPHCTIEKSLDSLYLHALLPPRLDWPVPAS